jgi:hypothetical protein
LKTGIALFDAEAQEVILFRIIPNGLAGFKDWWHTSGQYFRVDVLGCESFELEEGSHGIEYEAPLSIIHWLKELGRGIVWQRRMQRGKNTTASVPVLKRAGLYPKRGELKEGHQVAALQHALSYLIRVRHLPTIELLHPKED